MDRNDTITEIEKIIKDYYYELDCRKHGGVAQDKAFKRIEDILGMHWVQNQEADIRREEQFKKPVDKSFAKKYNLVDKGQPIEHSPKIEKMVEAASLEGKAFSLKCEASAKLDNTRYR